MIAWLWNTIVGQICWHRWKIIGEGRWKGDFGSGPRYDLQCEKCGNVKGQRTK